LREGSLIVIPSEVEGSLALFSHTDNQRCLDFARHEKRGKIRRREATEGEVNEQVECDL